MFALCAQQLWEDRGVQVEDAIKYTTDYFHINRKEEI